MNFNSKLREVTSFLDREWETVEYLTEAIKEDLSKGIILSNPSESEQREQLYYTAKAIDRLLIKIKDCINQAHRKIEENK